VCKTRLPVTIPGRQITIGRPTLGSAPTGAATAPPPESASSSAAHRLPFFLRLPFPDGSGAMVVSRHVLAVGAGAGARAGTAVRQPPDG